MKRLFIGMLGLLLGIGLNAPSQAFFVNPLIKSSFHRIGVQVDGNSAIVTLEQKLQNTSEDKTLIQLYHPFPEKVGTEIQFFVDAEGTGFETFSGNTRLNLLFDQASEQKDVRFLRLADGFDRLFRSSEISIDPEQTVDTKLTFTIPVQELDDMKYVEIFTDEGISHDEYEVIFQGPGTPIFTQTLGSGRSEVKDSIRTFWGKQSSFQPRENLFFLWSENPNATLEFHTERESFIGHFQILPAFKKFENIQILIDRSGSMYGENWGRIRDVTDFLFEKFSGANMRIGFFHQEIDWIDEAFQPNSIELQKQLSDTLGKLKPVGKVNTETFLESLETETESLLTLWITDDPSVFQNSTLLGTQAIFSFSGNVSLRDISAVKVQGGFIQYLFPSALKLIEKSEIERRFDYVREPFSLLPMQKEDGEGEVFPEMRTSFSSGYSPLFIGRKFQPTRPATRVSRFLMRDWTGQRIAQILDKASFPDEMLDALLAIGRTFGVETAFFQYHTDREILLVALENSLDKISEQVYFLQNARGILTQSMRYIGADPIYFSVEENIWRSWNFLDRVRTENQVKIAAYSPAHRRLFVEFSDMLAEAFGVGEQVEFCTAFRCFSLLNGEREESHSSDRAFLRDFDPNFWGNKYLIKLVNKGILEPAINGKMHPNRAIDRGEFLRMLYGLRGEGGNYELKITNYEFLDVSQDSDYFESVMWFADKGIVKGYPDETFRPLQSLTRAEAVKILLATDNFSPTVQEEGEPIFEDALGWERPWVEESFARGIVRGYEADGKRYFKPHQSITRAEASKLLVEMME